MKVFFQILLLAVAVSCCVASNDEAKSQKSDKEKDICEPDVSTIPEDSLPEIQKLNDIFANELGDVINVTEKHGEEKVPKEYVEKGAKLTRKFLETFKGNKNFSRTFSKECYEELDPLVKQIENYNSKSNSKAAANSSRRGRGLLGWLKRIFNISIRIRVNIRIRFGKRK